MRVLIVIVTTIIWSAPAIAQEAERAAWWADADLWKIAAPFFGAFMGFFGATFVNDWLHQRRESGARRQLAISLAVALKGEVLAAASSFERVRKHQLGQAEEWTKEPRDIYEDTDKVPINYRPAVAKMIYCANVERIGLLGDSELIADITQFYSVNPETAERKKVHAAYFVEFCGQAAALNAKYRDRANSIATKLQDCADKMRQ